MSKVRLHILFIAILIGGGFINASSPIASGSESLFHNSDYAGFSAASDGLDRWHLSTDIPAWAALVSNATGEYDFHHNWSAALTIRYSALDYFSRTRKFRTFELRPQIRRWIKNDHTGFFFDTHLAMIFYNVSLGYWNYRIQDSRGTHPALGGGIGAGYRLPFRNNRWAAEFMIGLGVYHLDYSRFYNKAGGCLVDRHKRTFFGIDRIGVSIVYNFNKRGL